MLNQKGLAPLLIPIIIVLLGVGGVVTYVGTKEKADTETKQNTFKILKKEGLVELPFLKIAKKEEKQENSKEDAKKESNEKECPKPNTWAQIITPWQVNDILNENYNVEFAGYTLEGGNVTFGDDEIKAEINIGNNKSIYTKLILTDKYLSGGKNFQVKEIKSTGNTKISSIELAAIKTTLNNVDKIVWNYVGENYKEMFQYIDIHPSKMDIFFYTSEYLDCINND